jgi:hypothetical protein
MTSELPTPGFNENPVQKVWRVQMVDAPQGYHAAAGQLPAAGNNNALRMGFQDRPLQDQMQVLYSQNAILRREFSELRASVENNAANNMRNRCSK